MNRDNEKNSQHDDGIEWDNGEATYGHRLTDIKRKDSPDEKHLQDAENDNINEKLKNEQLSQGEDIGARNRNEDKGLKGADL